MRYEMNELLKMVAGVSENMSPKQQKSNVEKAGELLTKMLQDVRVEQARIDAVLMRKLADNSPSVTPPKGGTSAKAVFETAAKTLDPDGLGWSLNLPDHLK